MGIEMDKEIERRTLRRKSALVLYVIQRNAIVSEPSRQLDLPSSEI
jgi:hypothetical protein